MQSRVEEALDKVRPAMRADGGDARVVACDEDSGSVSIQMIGACRCLLSQLDFAYAIESLIKREVPRSTGDRRGLETARFAACIRRLSWAMIAPPRSPPLKTPVQVVIAERRSSTRVPPSIPEELARTTFELRGAAGVAWLERLPALVAVRGALVARGRSSVPATLVQLRGSARRIDGTAAVLKLFTRMIPASTWRPRHSVCSRGVGPPAARTRQGPGRDAAGAPRARRAPHDRRRRRGGDLDRRGRDEAVVAAGTAGSPVPDGVRMGAGLRPPEA